MSNIKDVNMRLQLRHNDATQSFKGREDVITYIDNRLKYNSSDVSILPYEPLLFFYGEEETKNTIILVGLPEGETHDGKNYFLIDTAELKEAIANEAKAREDADGELKDSVSGLDKAIKAEADAREKADGKIHETMANNINILNKAIETVNNNLVSAVNTINGGIEAERVIREKADKAEADARAKADAEEVKAREDADKELTDALNFTKDDLESVIKACGLIYNDKLETDRVSYTPDMKDDVIREAKDVTEAIDLISKFATKVGKDLTLNVDDTDSVALSLEENKKGDGNVLTAEVKLSEGGAISSKTADDDNILSVQKDGLYATVDLSYEPHTHVLTFRKSDKKNSDGVEKTFELGGHTVYKGVNDGHTVKMTVETKDDNGTISGDVVVSTDSHNNLKVKDGALFVDNHSKSVVYDEDDSVTVYTKIHSLDESAAKTDDSIKAEVERATKAEKTNADGVKANKEAIEAETTRATKAEKTNADAIEANVKAVKTNADAIAVINGNEATEGSVKKALADANAHAEEVADAAKDASKKYTDAIAESIEVVKNGASDLQYILYVNKKNVGTIDIPKDQFLKDVSYNPKSKELTLIFTVGTGDAYEEKKLILSIADLVDVYKAGDGLSESDNKFSVKLSGDKETKNYLSVDEKGITLNGIDDAIESAVSDEAKIARKAEKENKDAIKANTDNIATIQGSGLGSITRALSDAKEYADAAVAAEKKRAGETEIKLENSIDANKAAIEKEVTRATNVEATQSKDIAANKAAIEKEVTRATNVEADHTQKIDNVTKVATANTSDIKKEVERATEKEADLLAKIGDNKTAIAANKSAIEAEAKRSSDKDAAHDVSITENKDAIDAESKRAVAREKEIEDKVAVNTNNITNVTGSVNDINKDISAKTERLNTVENAIKVINGDEKVEGSIKKSLDDAKKYTDAETALRKETDATLKASVDTEVKDRKDAVTAATADAKKHADDILATEVLNRTNADSALETKVLGEVDVEKNRAEKVEGEIKAIADKNTGDIADLTSSLKTLDGSAVKSVTLTKNADNALLYTLNVDGKTYDINIPQDQFLSNVTYDSGSKTLHFVFNVGDAKQDIDVQIGDLVDTYTAGNGMHVDNNAFSIQLQPTEQTVKYLEVSENGLGVKGLDEAIAASVKSVSDGVYTKKEIDDKDAAVKSVADANKTLIDSLTTRVTTNEDDIKANKEAITSKADASNVYTKAETYKKEEVDNAVSLKANTAEVAATYATKDELTKGTADINKAIDSKLDKDSAAATYATIGSVTTVDGKVDALKTELTSEISKKADAANVYTKLDITNELAKYEKTASVDTKLATKLDATTATQTYATKEALQGVKDAYATKEYVAAEDVKLNTLAEANKAAIDNFNVEYNPATSVLSYTDKKGTKNEYKLYSGSLIKSGKFDEKSNSIVLTIETAGQPSEISIPVSDLLSDVTSDITANANAIQSINDAIAKLAKKWDVTSTGTVTLKKSTTGETDSLSADVRVASSNKQAIQSKEGGLYVSNDLEDYTVAYGGLGTISGQTAISKLLEASTAVEGKLSTLATSSDTALATLKTQVETNTKSIEALRTDVTNNTAKINTISDKVTEHSTTLKELGEKVTKHTTDIATLTTQVNTIDKTVASHTTKIENLEGDVTTLQTTVSTINNDITNIKNDVKENKTNISKIEGKVETVENNLKTLETKVTTLESTVNNKITSLENTVKELTNTINNIQTNLEKTIESIVKEKVNEAIKISSAEGNIITNKTDGLYAAVDAASVLKTIPVSGAAGNIIVKNDDGLYAKVDETKIDVSKINLLSQTEGNLLEAKTDGLYLPNVFDEGEY